MEKLTKKDIISNIAEDSHLSKKDITEVVDLALTQIFEGLSEGKTVDLAGFGKFAAKPAKRVRTRHYATIASDYRELFERAIGGYDGRRYRHRFPPRNHRQRIAQCGRCNEQRKYRAVYETIFRETTGNA